MAKTVTAVQLAKELKLNPKRIRSILRSRGYEKTREGAWEFPIAQRTELKALIRATQRKLPSVSIH